LRPAGAGPYRLEMRVVPVVVMLLAASCAKGVGAGSGGVDAKGTADAPTGGADARGVPDAPTGTADAPTGAPDAAPGGPDASTTDAPPLGNGDTCATANDISGLATQTGGFTFNGDLTGLANDIEPSNGCTGFDNDGPDAVFIVTAQAGQTISASMSCAWDCAVEITTNCTLDAACVAGTDDTAGDVQQTEATSYVAPSAGTYYVIADSWDAGAYGPYSLTVTVQ
jgi:hypothetical protein